MGHINYRTILIGQKKGLISLLPSDVQKKIDSYFWIISLIAYVMFFGFYVSNEYQISLPINIFDFFYKYLVDLLGDFFASISAVIISGIIMISSGILLIVTLIFLVYIKDDIISNYITKGKLYLIVSDNLNIDLCYTTSKYPPLYLENHSNYKNPKNFERPTNELSISLSAFINESFWISSDNGIQYKCITYESKDVFFTFRVNSKLKSQIQKFGWEFFINNIFREIEFIPNITIRLDNEIRTLMDKKLIQEEQIQSEEYKYISEVFSDDVLKAFTTHNQLEDLVNINKSKHPLAQKIRETMM